MITRLVDGVEVALTAQESADLLEISRVVQEEGAKTVYLTLRALAYPPIGDQLDMMYKDKLNGTTLWEDLITSIKLQYPKPEKE